MSFDLEELVTRWKELATKSLSDLEKWGLTQVGLKEGKKFYHLTDKGRTVLKKAVESHFQRVSSVRSWFVKILVDLKMIEEPNLFKDMSAAMLPIRSAVLTLARALVHYLYSIGLLSRRYIYISVDGKREPALFYDYFVPNLLMQEIQRCSRKNFENTKT